MRTLGLAALAVAAVSVSACETTDPAVRGAGRGAAIGAAAGALTGAVVGGVGVAEGAAGGAAIGAVVGAATSGDRDRRYRWDANRCYYVDNDGRWVYVDRDRCN